MNAGTVTVLRGSILSVKMRLVDERACQILERTETLSSERLMKLHGAAPSLQRFGGAKR
jgi:hypothetical protein